MLVGDWSAFGFHRRCPSRGHKLKMLSCCCCCCCSFAVVLRIAVVAVSHREEEQEEQAWQPEFLISPGQDVRHHSLCSHDPAGERRNSGHGLMIVASSWKGWSWSTRDLPEFSYSSIQLMQQNSIPSIEYIYIYIYIYVCLSLSLSFVAEVELLGYIHGLCTGLRGPPLRHGHSNRTSLRDRSLLFMEVHAGCFQSRSCSSRRLPH